MAKSRQTVTIDLPCYCTPRTKWRRLIHEAFLDEARRRHVLYHESRHLEISLVLYMTGRTLEIHDVDNRLKDVMDALQGRAGGPKNRRSLVAIIPNDRQVYKVTVVKRQRPKQTSGHGRLTVRKHKS